MTRVELLAITAPFFAAVVMGLFLLVTNHFDDKATAKRQKQKLADAVRQTVNPAVSLPELSEAERATQVAGGFRRNREERRSRRGGKLATRPYASRWRTFPGERKALAGRAIALMVATSPFKPRG
jgi:hypothetical protein